ncbi:hypothetical protein EYC80_000565 [Monilinia laxa]|uniref:Secreted protein n=1 Tax=Monilinia laxa TaxID=61186 RepID=A0A5N6KB28_MONLA|nr:hypothetical protein EYC80_000565 [Monilinia laxa]
MQALTRVICRLARWRTILCWGYMSVASPTVCVKGHICDNTNLLHQGSSSVSIWMFWKKFLQSANRPARLSYLYVGFGEHLACAAQSESRNDAHSLVGNVVFREKIVNY